MVTQEQRCFRCRAVLNILDNSDLDRLIQMGMHPDCSEQLIKLMQLFRIKICSSCGNTVFEASAEIIDVLRENDDNIVGLS